MSEYRTYGGWHARAVTGRRMSSHRAGMFATGASRPEAAGSLPRAMILVRAIARAGRRGATLADLAAQTGLPRPTIHRVLDVLERNEWVERDPVSKAFFLGQELLCLGYGAALRHPVERIAAPILARLARDTGQTIYLSVRSGYDAVCIARHEGVAPVQTVAQYVGARLPLGHGAGSLALLAALSPDEAEEVIAFNLPRYRAANPGFDEHVFRGTLADTRERGFASHHGLHVRGLSGLGVAVGAPPQPLAAISTAFVTDWLNEDDQRQLAAHIRDAAGELARRLGLERQQPEKRNA